MQFKPLISKRKVDDCFLMFKDKRHVDLFLNFLSAKHSNTEFAAEYEEKNSLNYLDVYIT